MGEVFTSDRRWRFPVAPAELWGHITATGSYVQWWPWLRRFDPGEGLCAGAVWACVVQPPLPWRVRFTVELERVDPHRRAVARVRGDIEGNAVLTVVAAAGGSEARLRSSLRPAQPLMRRVARLARPLVRWGHDWVLDAGARQFAARALPLRGDAGGDGRGPGMEDSGHGDRLHPPP
jgi:hypothetical protein